MPTINVKSMKGRTIEQKGVFTRVVTEDVEGTTGRSATDSGDYGAGQGIIRT